MTSLSSSISAWFGQVVSKKAASEAMLRTTNSIDPITSKANDLMTTVEDGSFTPRLPYVDHEMRERGSECRFFLKKDEAIEWSRLNGSMPMWSIDKFATGGAKYFCVASYEVFWNHYREYERPERGDPSWVSDQPLRAFEALDRSTMSYGDYERKRSLLLKQALCIAPFAYEVVAEGLPSHLYLDIEASKVTNPDIDCDQLTEELLAEFMRFIRSEAHVPLHHLDSDRITRITMDSSTEKKFSKHIVLKIEDCMFENNYVMGALMRRFHIHLISRFGSEETNRFYVNPDRDAKVDLKVCLLDFAVYTKNRDFRLIGSCKRRGSDDPKTLLRFLWVENRTHELTAELFLAAMIQRRPPESKPLKFLISTIRDTINEGIPSSSSLRTAQPLGPERQQQHHSHSAAPTSSIGHSGGTASSIRLSSALQQRLLGIGEKIGAWLVKTSVSPFHALRGASVRKVELRQLRDGNFAWSITTDSSHCFIKKQKLGVSNHKVGGRTAMFIVWATGVCGRDGKYDRTKVGRVKQMCIANSCTGGVGPSGPAWSGWLGPGISSTLSKLVIETTEDAISKEIVRLGLDDVQNSRCLISGFLE